MTPRMATGWFPSLVLAASFVSACGFVSASPSPSSCNGVSAEAGGCRSDLPVFDGTTCSEVGKEWGQVVDGSALAVIDGPAVADGQQRSARIGNELALAFVTAAGRLEQLGLVGKCNAADFLAAAQAEFIQDLKDRVGGALYDGEPVATYDQFLAVVQNAVRTLDNP
jgi:hypothetical protein